MDKFERKMKKVSKFYNNPLVEETYSLDLSFIEFIIPRLKLFKEKANQIIVYDFTIIDKILEGFELYLNIFEWSMDECKINMPKVKKSMKLFAEHWTEFGW